MEPMSPAVLDLLRRPNPAVVATIRTDGAPVSAAVWYLWEEPVVLLTMGASSPRRRQLERDPRLTLTVLDDSSWYRQVTLHGEAQEVGDDPDLTVIDRLSQHYVGKPYDDRAHPYAFARIRVTEWNSFGV
ncbi:PPOX class F420-dependent oxidoreductase [uncultured Amnibacterium sp.]|uniref:PPOX class F420-dependent oxidoreductase n=1 Tax=uncultured Amnibacterium sp. TaxID=1631851 RepID=UPI0035C95CEB